MTTSNPGIGRKRRPLIVASAIFLTLLGLLLVAALGATYYVHTPAGSKRVMAWVQEILARDYNTTLSFDEAQIDLLSGIYFKNLSVLKPSAPAGSQASTSPSLGASAAEGLQAQIQIATFEIEYSFSIWHRKVEIKRFLLDQSSIAVSVEGAPPAKPEESQEVADDKSLLLTLQELIEKPFATLRAPSIEINHLNLDIRHTMSADSNPALPLQSTHLQLSDFHFSGGFIFEPADLQLHGRVKAAGKNALSVEMNDLKTSQSTALKTQLTIDSEWDLKIQKLGPHWQYVIDPLNFFVGLQDLQAKVTQNENQTTVRIPKLEARTKAQLRAQTEVLFHPEKAAFKTVDVQSTVNLSSLHLEQAPAKGVPLVVSMEHQSLRIHSQLGSPPLSSSAGATIQPNTDTPTADILSQIEFAAKRLTAASFLFKPASFSWNATTVLSRDLEHLTVASQVTFEKLHLLDLELHLDFSPKLTFSGSFTAKVPSALAKIVKPAASLQSIGSLEATGKYNGLWDSLGGQTSLQAESQIRAARFGDWQIATDISATLPNTPVGTTQEKIRGLMATGQTTITQVRATTAIPAQFKQAFTIKYNVDLTAGAQRLKVSGHIPLAVMPGVAQVSGTQLTLEADSPNFAAQQDVDFKFDFKQDKFILANAAAVPLSQFLGMKASLRGSRRQGSAINLDAFDMQLSQPSVQASAEGLGDIFKKTGSMRSEFKLRLPKGFAPLVGHQIQGDIAIPTSLVLRPLDTTKGASQIIEISLGGVVDLQNLSWKKEQMSFSGLTGRIPFNEKLVWDGSHLRFSHQLKQNPFERVDFERVRPMLQGTEGLRISQIQWEDRRFGPFIGFFSVRQNMLFAHQFDLNMGSGTVHGQMFLDANPSNLAIGILSRLTALDVREILPKKFLTRIPPGPARLAGRTGVVVDLNRLTVDGRMDITEIGGSQLIALINVLDPLYEDDKMNKVRSLLQVGYPTGIELAFAEGYMNMDIALSALGLTKRQSVRGIPISTLLANRIWTSFI